jgi:hypothetical protein
VFLLKKKKQVKIQLKVVEQDNSNGVRYCIIDGRDRTVYIAFKLVLFRVYMAHDKSQENSKLKITKSLMENFCTDFDLKSVFVVFGVP